MKPSGENSCMFVFFSVYSKCLLITSHCYKGPKGTIGVRGPPGLMVSHVSFCRTFCSIHPTSGTL